MIKLCTHMITEKCPVLKPNVQMWGNKGFAAAQAGKPLDAMEEADGAGSHPAMRMAWIVGWEYGGGDIHRRVVVPQRQRWEEERANLVERMAWLDERLAAQEAEKLP
jgi:hypothetical protein